MCCCPKHGEMLETSYYLKNDPQMSYACLPRRRAPSELITLDRCTLQAVTTGDVNLSNGVAFSAAVWMRALRCLVDELIRPICTLGDARGIIESAWKLAGLPMHTDLGKLRLLELLHPKQRERVLSVTAIVVQALMSEALEPSRNIMMRNGTTNIFNAEHRRKSLCVMTTPRRHHMRHDGEFSAISNWMVHDQVHDSEISRLVLVLAERAEIENLMKQALIERLKTIAMDN